MYKKLNDLRMGKENDGRIHITESHKKDIKDLHKLNTPIREISRQFEKVCSRRAIQFILFPERLKKVQERAKELKRWEPYNTKEIRKIVMRKHRAKLKRLYR